MQSYKLQKCYRYSPRVKQRNIPVTEDPYKKAPHKQ